MLTFDFRLTLKTCSPHVCFLFHLPMPEKNNIATLEVVFVKLFVCLIAKDLQTVALRFWPVEAKPF